MNCLQELFTIILNLSVTATYVAICVIFVRFFLRKAPKILSYVLWSVVLIRLICPLSVTSDFSILGLLDNRTQNSIEELDNIPQGFDFLQNPVQQTNIELTDNEINATLPQTIPMTSTKPIQLWIMVLSIVWASGVLVLVAYSVISYLKTKRQIGTAIFLKDNIYESDRISTAFVFGTVYPKIYMPLNISDTDISYILEHEHAHIIRRDHLIKPLAFLILIIHWFNPLMWLSFVLMSKDMEMSCDEAVLRKLGEGARGGYSESLLSQSMKRSGLLMVSPLAFGESHVKSRIKNVLKFKKPAFGVMAVAVILIILVSISLLTNPSKTKDGIYTSEQSSIAQQITPNPSEWLTEQNLGTDMAVLDYASDDIVIFHGYFGLFIYNLDRFQITQSLDLKPINCNRTQGDDYCEISVSLDGGTIYLHSMSSDDMYIYTVSSNTLQKSSFHQMEKAFGSQFVPVGEAVDLALGTYSYNAVKFDTNEYGFLYTSDWTLGTLTYIRGSVSYNLFK